MVDQNTYVRLFDSVYNGLKSKLNKELAQIKPKRKFSRIVKAKKC